MVTPSRICNGIAQLRDLQAVQLRTRATYCMQSNQQEAGHPDRSNRRLVMRLRVWYLRSIVFWFCRCGSLDQLPIHRARRTSRTRELQSVTAKSLRRRVGAPRSRIISSSVLTNCLSDFIPKTSRTCEVRPLYTAADVEPSSIAGVSE